MTQFQEIKLMNQSMILYLKSLGKNTARNEIINSILKDDCCFFKLDKQDAFMILEDIGISKENISSIYTNLVSRDNYYYLEKAGKLNENDKNIIIKYEKFEYSDLFKNNKKSEIVEDTNEIVEYKESLFKKIINKIKKFFW